MTKCFLSALAIGMAIFTPNLAASATVLNVDGNDGEAVAFGINSTDPIGAASQFQLDAAHTDVSISTEFFCTADCHADFYLSNGALGAGGSFLDILAISSFNSSSISNEMFSGLSLSAGLYSIIMVFTDGASGFGLWEASASPTVTDNGHANDGEDFLLTQLNFNSVTESTFESTSLDLLYTVEGSIVPPIVPLPAGGLLLLSGLAGLTMVRRIRA